MMKDPKIIIFNASYGYGHTQVSKALLSYFHMQEIKRVQIIDLLAEAHPVLDAISRFFYLKSTTYCPQLYGWSYYLSQNMQSDQLWAKWLNSLCIRKLKEIIALEKPDAVINTFPMLSVSELRKKAGLYIPTFTVLTDFVLHNRWIHPETDKYFVATHDMKNKMHINGIPNEQIKVTGIPVRPEFQKTLETNEIMRNYGLNPQKKYVLIVAGAYGIWSILEKMIKITLSLDDVHILIVCGRNIDMKRKLENVFADEPRMHIFEFVEQMQELMAISSCIITKAGGITLSEAITMYLPIVVYKPVPGQEKENAAYLADKKALFIANNLTELKKMVQKLLTLDRQTIRMKHSMKSLQKHIAAELIVSDVLSEIELQNNPELERQLSHES
ncbi:MAG: hypothetical protein JWM44_3284 [Bacilli bacterium]|nr:hypothetical protein [Bacilli bacterium]